MHKGALVLVGFMWSPSVLTQLFSLFSFEAIGYLLRPYFMKMKRIPYKVYHLMYVTKLSCTCRKRIYGRKEKKRKEKKRNKS
jgi:hypothetical protein